jgi:DNA-binding GntR family transcriptional regulator
MAQGPQDPQPRGSADPTARLRQAIIEGRFFPNERLVEADLVRRFGGTRAAVRLALAVLEQQGLVVRERNRGARVRLVTEREAVESIESRAMLEAIVARHAAQRATRADLEKLQSRLAEMEALSAINDLVGYSEANVGFHAEIARIAQHGSAAHMLAGLRAQTVVFQFRPLFEPGRAAAVDAEHRALVAAIASGDADRAEAAMRRHVDNVGHALRAAIAARRVVHRGMAGSRGSDASLSTEG